MTNEEIEKLSNDIIIKLATLYSSAMLYQMGEVYKDVMDTKLNDYCKALYGDEIGENVAKVVIKLANKIVEPYVKGDNK